MVGLPLFKSDDQTFQLLQSKWKSQLDGLLDNPILNGQILEGIVLAIGTNNIDHMLSRKQQGWFVTDTNASVQVFRSMPFNNKTLTLNSNAVATINLLVF